MLFNIGNSDHINFYSEKLESGNYQIDFDNSLHGFELNMRTEIIDAIVDLMNSLVKESIVQKQEKLIKGLQKIKDELFTKEEKIFDLTNQLLEQSHETLVSKISRAIDIGEWTETHNKFILPKIIAIALLEDAKY